MKNIEQIIDMCLDPEIRQDLLQHLAPLERMVREGKLLKMKEPGGTKAIFVNPREGIPEGLLMWDDITD